AGLPMLAHRVVKEDPTFETSLVSPFGTALSRFVAAPGSHRIHVKVDAVLLQTGDQVIEAIKRLRVELEVGLAGAREVMIEKMRTDKVIALAADRFCPSSNRLFVGTPFSKHFVRRD